MYNIVLVATLVIARINALSSNFISPYLSGADVERNAQPYFLGSFIAAGIENYFSSLAANDPYESVGPQEVDIQLSDGSFSIQGIFEGIRVEGFSNIIINRITSPLIPNYVDFDLVLPQAQISTDSSTTSVKFGSYNIEANGSGWLTMWQVPYVRVVWGSCRKCKDCWSCTHSPFTADENYYSELRAYHRKHSKVDGSLSGLDGSTNLNGFLNNDLQQFLSENSVEVNRVVSEFIRNQFNTM